MGQDIEGISCDRRWVFREDFEGVAPCGERFDRTVMVAMPLLVVIVPGGVGLGVIDRFVGVASHQRGHDESREELRWVFHRS